MRLVLARLDGSRTRLRHVGLQARARGGSDTGAVVAAEHPADEGDTTTLEKTLAAAKENLEAVDAAPTAEDPAECDRQGLSLTVGLEGARRRPLEDADLRAQAERFCALARRRGGPPGSQTTGLLSGWPSLQDRRSVSRRNTCPDRLRGRENVHKRYLLHVAGHNLSLLMRKLIGAGTPREAVAGGYGCICQLEPFWSLRWSSSSRRMAKPPSSRYVSPSSETRSIAPFSTGC